MYSYVTITKLLTIIFHQYMYVTNNSRLKLPKMTFTYILSFKIRNSLKLSARINSHEKNQSEIFLNQTFRPYVCKSQSRDFK